MAHTALKSLAWVALAAALSSPASAQTIDASSRGWYNSTGLHTAANLNTLVGQGTSTVRFRSFFVFDLATLTRPAGAGVLRLELESYLGPDPMEYVAIYDVSTDPADLVLDQTGRTDVYADLGGDVVYAAGYATPADVGAVIEFPLTPEAIAAINAAAGGRFAVGVSMETIRLARGNEYVRFSLAGEPRVHQLVLTEAPATLTVGPALAALVPPGQHSLTAQVVDGGGAPLAGAPVDFAVTSGPHAGAAQSVVSDATGAATFAYDGSGAGVDRILASLADGSANPSQAEATAFWDADCNANAIPDTCDLSCDGFTAACAAFPGCGGSLDADASGLPDECDVVVPPSNSAPDCSTAAASPGMMLRPDRRFREVAVLGVSDPDGDPVQIAVDAVFQDEPVDTLMCGPVKADALGVGGETVRLRAESRERGDGRVYHLAFSADDGRGGSCSGEVTVCVPRPGWRRSDDCVDQGPLHDSTVADPRRRGHGWHWWRHYRNHGRH
ncbi:MAG TPA: hypothetical protein VII72_12250 [Myxococcota bacterium]|jgi:hypothetical protein